MVRRAGITQGERRGRDPAVRGAASRDICRARGRAPRVGEPVKGMPRKREDEGTALSRRVSPESGSQRCERKSGLDFSQLRPAQRARSRRGDEERLVLPSAII